jgi:hypothetical protein
MAGLPEYCTAHGVRKGVASLMSDNEATTGQMKAFFGWRTSKEVDNYTAKAERKRSAASALARLQPPSTTVVPLERKPGAQKA